MGGRDDNSGRQDVFRRGFAKNETNCYADQRLASRKYDQWIRIMI